MLSKFLSKFLVLRGAPRELWIIYFTKVFEIIAYGLMSGAMVLWLSSDLGYSDTAAGDHIAIWSTILTLITVAVGSLADAIGLRKAFLAGFLICLGSRAFMTFVTDPWIVVILGMYPLAIGLAMMVPVMTAALKRYSSTAQRSMAFSMFYVLMNVGFAVAGWLFDFVRDVMGEYGTFHLIPGATGALGEFSSLSTYQTLFLISVVFTIPGWLATHIYMRPGIEMTDEGIKELPPREDPFPEHKGLGKVLLSMGNVLKKTGKIFAEVWQEPSFYKFLGFLFLVVGTRLVFYHMHYTFPKFGIRELGPGAPIGNLWSVLNPLEIVILVPILGVVTQKVTSYSMVLWGTAIGAASTFILAMDPASFEWMRETWFGSGIAAWLDLSGEWSPLYLSISLFVICFSVGEAFWSPRLYEYTAAIAPKGREASYMSLSLLPYFLAKLGVGMMSGRMLQSYCPSDASLAKADLIEKGILTQDVADKMKDSEIVSTMADRFLNEVRSGENVDLEFARDYLVGRFGVTEEYAAGLDLDAVLATIDAEAARGADIAHLHGLLDSRFLEENSALTEGATGLDASIESGLRNLDGALAEPTDVLAQFGRDYLTEHHYLAPDAVAALELDEVLPTVIDKLRQVGSSADTLSTDLHYHIWEYLQENATRNSEELWFWIAVMAAVTPIGLILLMKWIRVPEEGRGGDQDDAGSFIEPDALADAEHMLEEDPEATA